MTTEKNSQFVIARTFDVPRDRVWKAFTDPERMRHWWGPAGFAVKVSAMDLRPGGVYHYCLQSPDGKDMWGKFVYREIAAPERIAFVASFSDEQGGVARHPMSPTWPLEMLSTFIFDEHAGKTTFTVKWEPLEPTASERKTFDEGHSSMRQGWTGTLDKLNEYLGNERSSS